MMNLRGVAAHMHAVKKRERCFAVFDAPRATHQHKIAPLAHCSSSSDARWSFFLIPGLASFRFDMKALIVFFITPRALSVAIIYIMSGAAAACKKREIMSAQSKKQNCLGVVRNERRRNGRAGEKEM